jgi:energy-coupling factor transporter ATP-binding protein EcfA2
MKIRALRVAECGRFVEPVALEGLSGGLDLLIGPNEAGKSTLLKALRLALLTSHRSTKAEIGELKPYRGGSPLIEVELETGGQRWRVRKRFLTERMAEVISLSTGALMRGSDAEAKLEQLLDLRSGIGRFPLLWLGQGALLAAPAPDEAGENTLRAALVREVTAAAGGEAGRRIRARVQVALGDLLTPGRGQPTGRYRDVIREADSAAAELAQCRQAYREIEGHLDRLAGLGEASASLTDPIARAERLRRVGETEARWKQGNEDVTARDGARVALAEARVRHSAATAATRTLVDGLDELAAIEVRACSDATLARDLAQRLDAAEIGSQEAAKAAAQSRAALAAAEVALEQAASLARYRDLAERATKARAASTQIDVLEGLMNGLPLDDALVREARRLSSDVAEAGARLEASSSAVTVDYESAAVPRIVIDGRSLADGERLLAIGRVVLQVPGLGRITVEPGVSRDREQLLARRADAEAALGRIFLETGSVDLADLERRHTIARETAGEIVAARAALTAAAPAGIQRLEDELSAAATQVETLRIDDGGPDSKCFADAVVSLRGILERADATARERTAACETLRREVAVQSSRGEERDRRRAQVEAVLPPPPERDRLRAEAEAAAQAASLALDEALRIEAAWTKCAPSADALARLEAELADARRDLHRAEQEEAALAAERARIEGALEAARREDITTRLAALESEAERALARKADLAEEVEALRLLDAELGSEEERLRDSYLAPVLSRLAPYVDLVFPTASVALGDKYTVTGLVRNEREEAFDHLSDGTREQIAVLTRLAFARLLADQGMGVPLVLDDVLVYSDDRRIGAMHRALEAAAEAHQVIVLSCREQSFAGLRGARVAIVPWNPDKT